jgi:hypothetical protein
MSYLDKLIISLKAVYASGNPAPYRPNVNFVGATYNDNAATNSTDVTTGGGPPGSGPGGGYSPGIYGDGSDGTHTADGTTSVPGMTLSGGKYTLNRDGYYANLTINAGVTVVNGGFRLFVNGTFTCNGHYSTDGGTAVDTSSAVLGGGGGGAGGSGSGTGTIGAGGDGGPSGGSNVTYSFGGAGGNCGFGTTGGTVTQPPANFGQPRNVFSAATGTLWSGGAVQANFNGGSGGGSAASCSAGAGGGVSIVCAANLTGSGSITANGGNSFTSATYGGGGGGGGVNILVVGNFVNWTGLQTANGGLHSTGSGGAGTAGTDGAAGTVITIHA